MLVTLYAEGVQDLQKPSQDTKPSGNCEPEGAAPGGERDEMSTTLLGTLLEAACAPQMQAVRNCQNFAAHPNLELQLQIEMSTTLLGTLLEAACAPSIAQAREKGTSSKRSKRQRQVRVPLADPTTQRSKHAASAVSIHTPAADRTQDAAGSACAGSRMPARIEAALAPWMPRCRR